MNYIKYFGAFLCLSLTMMTVGCSMNDDLECPSDPSTGSGTGKAYVQLSFTMPGGQGTRANPTGGENGDGNEAGQEAENTIISAVAFLYKDKDGVNGSASENILEVLEFNSFIPAGGTNDLGDGDRIDRVYTTNAVQTSLEYGTYNLIVIANLSENDNTQWWRNASLTLGYVRDHIQTQAWNGNGTNFLMSLADETSVEGSSAKITVDETCTEENPATTTVDVERMAARIDYKADNEYRFESDAGFDYDENYEGATVKILGATIINQLTAGSYLLKRVAGEIDGTPLYLGKETVDGQGLATNYVIDPWTADKNSANTNLESTPFIINRNTPQEQSVNAAGLYAANTYLPSGSDNPEDWSGWVDKEGTPVTDPEKTNENWMRIGYTLENTTSADETSKAYNTGVVFKAQFVPSATILPDYTEGQTFFRLDNTLYLSLTDMMGQLNQLSDQTDFTEYVNDQLASITDRDGVTNFANTLVDDPTGYRDYLLNANASGDFNKDNLSWTYYLNNKLGCVEGGSDGPEINQKDVKTRQVLYEASDGRLYTYYHGECYYLWWVRHCNDGEDLENGVMEYAIVRNNIYKLSVSSIYTIGGDIPTDENIRLNVYVRKWTMLGEETLPM